VAVPSILTEPGTKRSEPAWSYWDGRPVRAFPFLAFDTETEVVDLTRRVPRMALMTVSNGSEAWILHPDQVGRFMACHYMAAWAGFNVAFDYWVVHDTLPENLRRSWRTLAADGRLRDAMLLDFLVRLAADEDQGVSRMRGLGLVARDYGRGADKEDPCRKQYGQFVGLPEREWRLALQVDPRFIDYAVNDVAVTHEVYEKLEERAVELGAKPGLHGLLTETLQVRASLVLADIGRRGMSLDQSAVLSARDRLKGEIDERIGRLRRDYPACFKPYVRKDLAGQLRLNKRTGVPCLVAEGVRQCLTEAAGRVGMSARDLPTTPKGDAVSTAMDWWKETCPTDPFVELWTGLADTCKLYQFLVQLDGKESIHPSYVPLVRTGRTSCRQPNIQQMPREPWFRRLFVARPGHKLIIADYAAIELRTLAAVLLARFGQSKLADVIRRGVDPHAYTAAMTTGMTLEEFMAVKKKAPDVFKHHRQAAKAINFGVPGGLGPRRLAEYARLNYGVDMDVEHAKALREKLIHEVYPEIGEYLKDDALGTVARALKCDRGALRQVLNLGPTWNGQLTAMQNIVAGKKRLGDRDYAPGFRDSVFNALDRLNENPALRGLIESYRGSERLRRRLFGETVATLTGRLRAGADYGEARNTPFQGLAADGAKEALWRLHKNGWPLVAFVHDEIVAEVPADGAGQDAAVMREVMIESMSFVLDCDLPVEVEVTVSDAWTK
jgi:DNA polymerase I-like protein with 3'-5' exonuclease and polymerase domains